MKETKKQKQEAERELKLHPINNFTCCDKVFTFNEFKVHLSEVHKLLPEQMKGKKQMLMHMDGDYWFAYEYVWELETGLKFGQYTKMVRADDDLMRYP